MYLFADKFAPKDKAMTAGIEVPCKDLKVQRKPLAGMMFAAAFSGLREHGLLSLEVVQKKILLVKTRQVVAKRLMDEARLGLEGAVMAGVGPQGDRVKTIVYKWFDRDSFDPWHHVISTSAEEALEQGFMKAVDAERGKVAGFILGKTRIEPDCSAITRLEGVANDFVTKWQNFQSSEPELYKELLEECSSGISSRLETRKD